MYLTASATLGGCWLLTADLDLVGGTDGPRGAEPQDAGVNDAGVNDANDAANEVDSASDAGLPLCAPRLGLLFCDDFQRSDVTGVWGKRMELAGGLLSIVTPTVADPATALSVFGPASVISSAYLEKTLAASPAIFTVAYRIRADALPPTADGTRFMLLNEVELDNGPPGQKSRVFVTVNEIAGAVLLQYADWNSQLVAYDYYERSMGSLPLGQWQSVRITVDTGAKAVSGTASFLAGAVSVPIDARAKGRMSPAALTARVGATYSNAAPQEWRVVVDDYALTTP